MASNIPSAVPPTQDEIAKALWATGGLLKHASQQLNCSLEELKKTIKNSKQLRTLLFTIRESCIDDVESTLMKRITGEGDISKIKDNSGILTMFYLKCLGKHRGWVDKIDKAGESSKKPLYIKIMPVGIEAGKSKGGRPKKL
jgi:uncharacterized protein Yka (UPF0111/DUF47 family)